MMKFLTLVFISFSTFSWAIDDLIRELDSIGSINQDCSKMSNSDLAVDCAHQVCGKPKPVQIKASKAKDYLSDVDFKKMQDIEKNLKEHYKKLEGELTTLINEFDNRKNSPQFSDISDWKGSDFEHIINYLWNRMDLDVDYSQSLDQRKPKLISVKSHPLYPAFNEVIGNFDIKKDPYRSLAFGLITSDEFKTLVQKKINEYEATLRQQNKNSSFDFNKFRFQVSSGVVDEKMMIKFYEEIVADSQKNGIEIVPNTCGDQCKKEAQNIINRIDPRSLKKEFDNSLKKLNIEDRVANCKASFLAANLENKRKDDLLKRWPEIKKGYKDNVFPHVSEHSRKLLQEYLDNELNLVFANPSPAKFHELNLNKSLALKDSKTSNKEYINHTLSLLNTKLELPQCAPFDEPIYTLWDQFASKELLESNPTFKLPGLKAKQDNIIVSPFSCEHHHEGNGIIAHEVGHAISAAMARPSISKESKKAFLKWRSCVSDKWQKQPKAQMVFHSGDRFYTEEDTADFLSYMAMPDATALYGCALLKPDELTYTALSTGTSHHDNHTPGMIRLLREIKYKAPNKVPASCGEIMKRNADKIGETCRLSSR